MKKTYTIKPGDTGFSIAKSEGVTFAQLFRANPGTVWEELKPGSTLQIPDLKTIFYTVQPGDTGLGIAGVRGFSFSILEMLNPKVVWHKLQPGQQLNVPQDDDSNPHTVKDCVGAPVTGVPAQMPPPTASSGTSMTKETRAKVAKAIGIPEDSPLMGSVLNMEWPGFFFMFQMHGLNGGERLAIVDLRDPNDSKSTHFPSTQPSPLGVAMTGKGLRNP